MVRIQGEKSILAIGPASTQFTELGDAELEGCSKIGETHLCIIHHMWSSDPTTSCLAIIYFQGAATIKLRCKVATEPANFILERLN